MADVVKHHFRVIERCVQIGYAGIEENGHRTSLSWHTVITAELEGKN